MLRQGEGSRAEVTPAVRAAKEEENDARSCGASFTEKAKVYNASSSATHHGAKEENKKAKNKPKHLKRKLENLERLALEGGVGANEQEGMAIEDRRRNLLQEMKRWEESKAEYLQQKKKRRKQQKRTLNPASDEKQSSCRRQTPSPPRRTDESKQQGDSASSRPEAQGERKSQPGSAVPLPRGGDRARKVVGSPSTSAGNKDDDDDSRTSDSSGDEEETLDSQRRQRGGRRRRRGRASKNVGAEESTDDASRLDSAPEDDNEKGDGVAACIPHDGRRDVKTDGGTPPFVEKEKTKSLADDSGADIKSRYCVGRKPVTDFVVGQKCSGKVVYVKPFGIFLDVGCHSDAFCHVSRLDDSYVEDPGGRFRPGDVVESVRVVEIDRSRKRITVSLQSDERIADERASIEAREERLSKRRNVPRRNDVAKPARRGPGQLSSPLPSRPSPVTQSSSLIATSPISPKEAIPAASGTDGADRRSLLHAASRPSEALSSQGLKRARKLERRASRRAQRESSSSAQ